MQAHPLGLETPGNSAKISLSMAVHEHERGLPADEWIRQVERVNEESIIPGDRYRTAELLRRLKENPDLRKPKRGRPRGAKNTNPHPTKKIGI